MVVWIIPQPDLKALESRVAVHLPSILWPRFGQGHHPRSNLLAHLFEYPGEKTFEAAAEDHGQLTYLFYGRFLFARFELADFALVYPHEMGTIDLL